MDTIKIKYRGKDIETNVLYRYAIDTDTGSISMTIREIDHVTPTRIRFTKGTTVSIDVIDNVINGRIVYLPVEDKNRVIDLMIDNYKTNIMLYKEKVSSYKEKLAAFKELNKKGKKK